MTLWIISFSSSASTPCDDASSTIARISSSVTLLFEAECSPEVLITGEAIKRKNFIKGVENLCRSVRNVTNLRDTFSALPGIIFHGNISARKMYATRKHTNPMAMGGVALALWSIQCAASTPTTRMSSLCQITTIVMISWGAYIRSLKACALREPSDVSCLSLERCV